MRLHAHNTIVEKQNEDQQAVLSARKCHLSGKRRVIDGKHLITEVKLIGIKEAQEATRQRKVPKRGKRKRKGRCKAREESSDESEVYLDIMDDEGVNMLDCIEVEM